MLVMIVSDIVDAVATDTVNVVAVIAHGGVVTYTAIYC